MKKTFSFSFFLLLALGLAAQTKYPASTIPPALLKDAHVVKRAEEINFEVVDLGEAVYKRKVALTILDEAGQRYASLVVGYDRLRKITDIEGALYDAAGNQLKKVKGKEINDYSAVDGISLYDDARVKVHDFKYRTYPYTVEYAVEVAYNNTYSFPDFVPQSFEHLSVEKSSYTFVAPAAYRLRYKPFNYKGAPAEITEKEKKVMKWEVSNVAAITRPIASPPWHELTPTVFFAPSEFQMEGYKGNASTWQEYGKFNLLLNSDRDKLPADLLQKAKAIAESTTDTKEKIRKLYEFMQQHTRYISIQLGIGGLQPFDASYVAQKGYGDCKALSNYMYSLLKAVGIKSYYTVVQAGETADDQYLMEDFPSHQSNHVVLFVPLAKDTMWLECTNQNMPAGYMGGFTGNRKALAIAEDGGRLIATPRYGIEENVQLRKITGTIDAEGNLVAAVNTRYRAMQQDDVFGVMNALSKEKVKERLNEELSFASYDVGNFSYNAKKDVLPEVEEQLNLTVSNYATVSGRRFFVVPNLMSRNGSKSFNADERTCDFVFGYAYRDIDSVEVDIPADYQVEAMPQPVNLKTAYGNYQFEAKVDGAKIRYYRKMERFSGRYPAKEATPLAKFYEDVYKADRSRIVLVKKEG